MLLLLLAIEWSGTAIPWTTIYLYLNIDMKISELVNQDSLQEDNHKIKSVLRKIQPAGPAADEFDPPIAAKTPKLSNKLGLK